MSRIEITDEEVEDWTPKVHGIIEVGAVQARPRLESAWFHSFNLQPNERETCSFNFNLVVSELAPLR